MNGRVRSGFSVRPWWWCSHWRASAYVGGLNLLTWEDIYQHTIEELRLEIGQLGAHARLAQLQAEQASEISSLREKVNVEYRYLEEYESKKYNFKAWLKKKHLSSALIEKMLADAHLFRTAQETRKHYEYFLHVSLHCTDEEMEDFTRLWKMMLLRP